MSCNSDCFRQLGDQSWSLIDTRFSCQQLIDYCHIYIQWLSFADVYKWIVNCSLIGFGALGVVSYVLMLMLYYRNDEFKGHGYFYHRMLAIIEFFHMIVMTQCGVVNLFTIGNNYSFVVYRDILLSLWVFGDAIKLSVGLVTMVLALECGAALWQPTLFKYLNRLGTKRLMFSLSLICGLLHFAPLLRGPVFETGNGTYAISSNSTGLAIEAKVWTVIFAVKIANTVGMLVFCIWVVVGLVIKWKRQAPMVQDARQKWRVTKRLCAMQLIVSVTCLIDHTVWIISHWSEPEPAMVIGLDAVRTLDYRTALDDHDHYFLKRISSIIETITGEIDHACRLALYLVCMKSFRRTFINYFLGRSEVKPFTSSFVGVGSRHTVRVL